MEHFCPFCPHKPQFRSFKALREHVIKVHLNGKCPVCGKEVKVLRVHAVRKAEYGDEEHMILLGLIGARKWKSELKKRCYDLAEEKTLI